MLGEQRDVDVLPITPHRRRPQRAHRVRRALPGRVGGLRGRYACAGASPGPLGVPAAHRQALAARSLSLARPADWKTYCRRGIRYSLCHFQNLLRRDVLVAGGLAATPVSVEDLYARGSTVAALRLRPGELAFDRLAFRQIRRERPARA